MPLSNKHTYDVDGWYAGCRQKDIDAGRVTDTDPCVVDGGPAAQWNGTTWEFPFPAIENTGE